jgi:hypothetical protein
MTGGMSAWDWETESCTVDPVVRLDKLASDPEVNWTPTTGVQDYDLLRGFVDNLFENASTVDLGITECLVNDTPFTYHRESGTPPVGDSYFYLTRQKDGTWGQSSQGQDRAPGSEDCGLP